MLSFAVAEQDCFGSLLWLLNSKGSSWEDGVLNPADICLLCTEYALSMASAPPEKIK